MANQKNNKNTNTNKKGNYAFIDNQNLNLGIRKLGWKMDWRKFRKYLKESFNVTEAYMFIGHMPEHEDMYLQLHDAGYLIVLKPTFDMSDPKNLALSDPTAKTDDKTDDKDKKPVKGNVDAELVLWAVKEMKNYNKAVIVSGDGDFYSLVEYLEQENKLLNVLAPNSHYSRLYNKYDQYVERIDKQKRLLSYRSSKPSKAK